mmetsp:Transcript_67414/g.209355  ORF Transcript_67414/g.209355 Transcript_67414/m.209355 type:complete len:230 (-) Transcript_67414:88-777(-)
MRQTKVLLPTPGGPSTCTRRRKRRARSTRHISRRRLLLRSRPVLGNWPRARAGEQRMGGPRGKEAMRTSECSESAGSNVSLFDAGGAAGAAAPEDARQLSLCLMSLSACLKACCTELPCTSEWQRLCRNTDAPLSTSSLPVERSTVITCGTPALRKRLAAACGCGVCNTTSRKRAVPPSLGDGAKGELPASALALAAEASPPTGPKASSWAPTSWTPTGQRAGGSWAPT